MFSTVLGKKVPEFLCLAVLAVQTAAPDVVVVADHNPAAAATFQFKFPRVAPPAKDDAAAKATTLLVDGERDPNGATLAALVDGLVAVNEDEPGANFFFNAGTLGGRLRLDLGRAIDIAEVRTYSWHANTRAAQVYTLYASDGTAPGFNAAPKGDVHPGTAGWTYIATVDTRPKAGLAPGGQDGVSITKRAGASLGTYRYLLFLCDATEVDDDWGNTFYSEIDVIARTGIPDVRRYNRP